MFFISYIFYFRLILVMKENQLLLMKRNLAPVHQVVMKLEQVLVIVIQLVLPHLLKIQVYNFEFLLMILL
jgi:hypothetical protein